KQVVSRMRGKGKGPTLAEDATFRAGAKLRDRSGLFGYANLAEAGARLGEWLKGNRPGGPGLAMGVMEQVLLGNGKAFRTAAASLTLRDGTLDLLAQVTLDPKESSPLLELLPDQKAN